MLAGICTTRLHSSSDDREIICGHNSLPRGELEKAWLPSFVGGEFSFLELDSALVVFKLDCVK